MPKKIGSYSRSRLLRDILERDGHHCHICGLRVMQFGKHLAASLDHVIPQADGGQWTHDNLLLAHRLCNSLRGHNSVTPDLRARCRARIEEIYGISARLHPVTLQEVPATL